jgi:hypothetical protein
VILMLAQLNSELLDVSLPALLLLALAAAAAAAGHAASRVHKPDSQAASC